MGRSIIPACLRLSCSGKGQVSMIAVSAGAELTIGDECEWGRSLFVFCFVFLFALFLFFLCFFFSVCFFFFSLRMDSLLGFAWSEVGTRVGGDDRYLFED